MAFGGRCVLLWIGQRKPGRAARHTAPDRFRWAVLSADAGRMSTANVVSVSGNAAEIAIIVKIGLLVVLLG